MWRSGMSFFDTCLLWIQFSSWSRTVHDAHLKPEYVKGLVFVQFTRLNLIIMWANNGDGQYHCQFVTDLRLGNCRQKLDVLPAVVEIISSVISHLRMIVQTKQDWYYKSFVPFPKDSIVEKYIYTLVFGWISYHVRMSHYYRLIKHDDSTYSKCFNYSMYSTALLMQVMTGLRNKGLLKVPWVSPAMTHWPRCL